MGTTRDNRRIDTAARLQGEITPYVATIENQCGSIVVELLGHSRQGLTLTTGARLDMLRSLETVNAACRSVKAILRAQAYGAAAAHCEEVR